MQYKEARTIGQRINDVFEASGMSEEAFADAMGCDKLKANQFFSKCNIDIKTLIKLSKVLKHNFLDDVAEIAEEGHVCFAGRMFPVSEYEEWESEGLLEQVEEDYLLIDKYLNEKKSFPRDILFEYSELETPTSTPKVTSFRVPMPYEQYSRLLMLLIEKRNLTVNQLQQYDMDLYTLITTELLLPLRCIERPRLPYIIFMTEAQADVLEIIGEPNDSYCILMEDRPDGSTHAVWVTLERNTVTVSSNTMSAAGECSDDVLFSMAAVDFHKRLGTKTFKEVKELFKANRNAYQWILAKMN